ncbi:MAG: hypothetical protein ACYS6I_01435 [Planctomycetota bacterium]|jgi:vacuolar-type H+-ATPase subunit I/STV1
MKPETQIEIGKYIAIIGFFVLSFGLLGSTIRSVIGHGDLTTKNTLNSLLFMFLYVGYVITIAKRWFKTNVLFIIIFVSIFTTSCFLSESETFVLCSAFLLILLLSQATWGMYREKRKQKVNE